SLVSLIQWQASHRHLHSFPTRRSSDLADQPSATSYRDRGDSPTRPGAHPYPATMRDESAFLTTQTDKKKPFSQSFRRNNMIPVILSGGSGSRPWPLSRKLFPKQFLALTGEQTLFQQTVERLAFEGMQPPLLVCNKEHRFIVKEQLAARKLSVQGLMLEPFGRNTAPAVAIAAMKLIEEGRDELLLI